MDAAEVSEPVAAGLDEVDELDDPLVEPVEDEPLALVVVVEVDASTTVPPAAMGVEMRSSYARSAIPCDRKDQFERCKRACLPRNSRREERSCEPTFC